MAGGVVAALAALLLSMFANELLTWTGVTGVLIATLPGWWWLATRTKRFYVQSDLVLRDRV